MNNINTIISPLLDHILALQAGWHQGMLWKMGITMRNFGPK
jgi:hypothetical protein